MRIRVIFLNVVFLLTTAVSIAQKKESFEGIITYKVSTEFKEENFPDQEYFEGKYGDTLKVYYNKNGDLYKKVIGSGEFGYDFNLYVNKENNYYSKWKSLDTLYYYNVSEETLNEISRENGEINEKTSYFTIKGVEPNSGQIITQTFYYTGSPYVKKDLFLNFFDFFTNDFYKLSNSAFQKLELDLGNHTVTYEALKIESKELDNRLFSVPSDLPKKKY